MENNETTTTPILDLLFKISQVITLKARIKTITSTKANIPSRGAGIEVTGCV